MDEGRPEQALAEVWEALRTHYPMLEYLGALGERWYEEFLPRVRAAGDAATAYPIIEELVLRLQDCHTRLLWPGKPVRVRPALRLGWVEGGVAVLRADPATGLVPGDRVRSVDGTDAVEAVRQAWPRSQGATPEGHAQSACDRLSDGPPGSLLALGVGDRVISLVRPEATGARAEEPLAMRWLPGREAALLRIPRWSGGDLVARLDALLEEIRPAPGLVIDVRGNGGGDDANGRALVGRLMEREFVCSIALYREAGTATYRKEVATCIPRGPWRYSGRVAVLADGGCHSACVHFVAAIAASGRACILGQPTDGGCGLMQRLELPCGLTLICSRTFPIDGGTGGLPSPLHGTPPHIAVPPRLEDLRAGRDGPLDAALDWLRSGAPVPARTLDASRITLPA